MAGKKDQPTGGNYILKSIGILLVLILLVVLKSGEDSYNDLISHSQRTNINPYEVLGVPRTASRSEIRKSYRNLSLKWHPDKRKEACDDQCRETFRTISESYKVLSNDKSRQLYDQTEKISLYTSQNAYFNLKNSYEYLFNPTTWQNIIAPSISGKQLWTPDEVSGIWVILLAESRAAWSEQLGTLWTDLSSRFHGRISFARLDPSDSPSMKYLPLTPKITPAIILLKPDSPPLLYDKISNFQPLQLVQWLHTNIPNVIKPFNKPLNEMENLLFNPGTGADKRHHVVIFSTKKLPTLIKTVAQKTSSMISWISTQQIPDTFIPFIPANVNRNSPVLLFSPGTTRDVLNVLSLPAAAWVLDEQDLDVTGLYDTHQEIGVNVFQDYMRLIKALLKGHEIPLVEESLPFLCPISTGQERVICSVRIDPPHSLNANEIMTRTTFILSNNKTFAAPSADNDLPVAEMPHNKRLVNHVALFTDTLRAVGSSLPSVVPRDTEYFLLDRVQGQYLAGMDQEWTPLPRQCQATSQGKNSIFRRLLLEPPKTCAPEITASTIRLARLWAYKNRESIVSPLRHVLTRVWQAIFILVSATTYLMMKNFIKPTLHSS